MTSSGENGRPLISKERRAAGTDAMDDAEGRELYALRIALPLTVLVVSFFVIALGVPAWIVLTYGPGRAVREWPATLITCGIIGLISVWMTILLRRGRPIRVGKIGAISLWLMMTLWMLVSTGIREVAVGVYLLVELVAGLVWGPPGVTLVGIYSAVVLLLAYWMESSDRIPGLYPSLHPFHLITVLLILGIGSALIQFLIRAIQVSFHRVRVREQALAESNRELEAQRQELLHRNAELDAFAQTVAHDLRNPLSALITMNRMLMQRGGRLSPAHRARYLASMDEELQTMNRIIDAILLLARLRSHDEIAMAPLTMSPIVERVWERLEPLRAKMTDDDVTLVTPSHWPIALGYEPWVEEVWANLLSNAVKYGGRPLWIEVGGTTMDTMARFWVRDKGPGLSLDAQARIFTPFERLHNAGVEGEGLGLSIVQRIVSRLGGDVGVDSRPGEGSTFEFTLPLADSTQKPPP